MNAETPHPKFRTLIEFLDDIPGVSVLSQDDFTECAGWWVKLEIDISQPHAWNIVQEFGHILNYLSINERLPTDFKPVSPPPYMNGGPSDFLSWVIECKNGDFPPGTLKKWLEGRLPNPANELTEWETLER